MTAVSVAGVYRVANAPKRRRLHPGEPPPVWGPDSLEPVALAQLKVRPGGVSGERDDQVRSDGRPVTVEVGRDVRDHVLGRDHMAATSLLGHPVDAGPTRRGS